MTTFQRTTLALSVPLAAACVIAGCGREESVDNPTTPGTISGDVSTRPATTQVPTPTVSAAQPAPTTGGSQSPSTAQSPAGPSQTVSGGNSVSPPPVQRSPSAPTGDNLPGEDSGPQGRPGAPGRN